MSKFVCYRRSHHPSTPLSPPMHIGLGGYMNYNNRKFYKNI